MIWSSDKFATSLYRANKRTIYTLPGRGASILKRCNFGNSVRTISSKFQCCGVRDRVLGIREVRA